MSQNEQLISALIAARDSLTPDNWRKGFYFQKEPGNPNICMCAHGALQVQVNPACRKAYEKNEAEDASDAAVFEAAASIAHDGKNAIHCYTKKSIRQIWNDYKCKIDLNKIHFLLGMVGLTAMFNDHPKTTLKMVKTKFDEAIQFAQTLD